jgi:recombination protein RecR
MYTGPLRALIDEFGRLPGIGPKSAQRIAFHILKVPNEDARRLSEAIIAVKERTTLCDLCFNVAEDGARCAICTDDRRDDEVLCIVEDPRDIVAVERTGQFRGRYHVLGGALNPLEGVGPEQLKVRELLARIDEGKITEAIVCTNPNLEGEATAMYVARLLNPLGVVVSRLASGLPVGGDLEYADELTLGRALEGRRTLEIEGARAESGPADS